MSDSRYPFITLIAEPAPTPKPLWNMLDEDFADKVNQELIWTQAEVDKNAFTLSDEFNQIDKHGNLNGPFQIFIPYPSKPGFFFCQVIYHLPINADGKMIASKSPRVALLARPNKTGAIRRAYVLLSALPCPFTIEDRVRPMQANRWVIWEGKANGTLVNLAVRLGFEQSDFSPKKKSDVETEEKTGICALQSKFIFDERFKDESAMVRDLEERFEHVLRWSAMSQPIRKEDREHLLATGERRSPLKKKAASDEDKASEDEAEASSSSPKKSKKKDLKKKHKKESGKKDKKESGKKHKSNRDSSPARKVRYSPMSNRNAMEIAAVGNNKEAMFALLRRIQQENLELKRQLKNA